ncbi:MAG: MarR family transcriptional regulator [Clostridia bacterium]|nr:MarR family transcriptional regulator [Clostridia bacterium]
MPDFSYIGPLIKLLNKEFEQLHSEKAKSMGLTPAQLFVLHYIAKNRCDGICHRDIEKQFDLSHATVSGIISRLEAKGFITCSSSENDRRFKNIDITQKAKCCEDEMWLHINHYEEQLVKGFSDEEKKLLIDFITRMLLNVDADINILKQKEEEKC